MDKFSTEEAPFTASDVWLTFGVSGALYTSIGSLCEKGENILAPRPGFPLCKTICENLGVDVKFYDLDPENEFKVKLDTVEAAIDEKTKAFLVINPSNPCGSVFSKDHMVEIAELAAKKGLVILADEIYHGLNYGEGTEFHTFASVARD